MENLSYLIENLMFISSFQDLIYSTLFYIVWIVISMLLIFIGIKVALAGLVLIPIISLVIFPDTMSLALGKSIYFLIFDLILIKLLLIPLNKKFPSNSQINLNRFQLSKEQLIDFKKMVKGFKQIDDELNSLNSLDIDRRADGKYSERSKKGKAANARLEELRSARFALWRKEAEYMDKQNKFSSFRFAKNIFDRSVLNSIVLSIIFTIITLFFVSKEIAVYYGYINLLLFVVFSIILFFVFYSKLEKQEEELYDMVYDYYLTGKGNTTSNLKEDSQVSTSYTNVDEVNELLQKNLDINSVDEENQFSKLHYAAMDGDIETVKLLIENGADVNLQGRKNWTPLYRAIIDHKSDVALYLIENGADVNIKDSDGWTALHRAIRDSEIEVAKKLVENGADVNAQNNKGWTPLHRAISDNQTDFAKYLIENGADGSIENCNSENALDFANKKSIQLD